MDKSFLAVCGLIGLVYLLSGFNDGFSLVQTTVLVVPLAYYIWTIIDFGVDSTIEMGVSAIILAILLAILYSIYVRWQRPSQRVSKPISGAVLKSPKTPQNVASR